MQPMKKKEVPPTRRSTKDELARNDIYSQSPLASTMFHKYNRTIQEPSVGVRGKCRRDGIEAITPNTWRR